MSNRDLSLVEIKKKCVSIVWCLSNTKGSSEMCGLEFQVGSVSSDVCSHGEDRKLSLISYQVKQMAKGKGS